MSLELARLSLIEAMLVGVHEKLERIIRMSQTSTENLDQRLADLTTDVQTLITNGAKFRTDVLTELTNLGSTGTLTAAQQAAFDNLMNLVTTENTAVTTADSDLPINTGTVTNPGTVTNSGT